MKDSGGLGQPAPFRGGVVGEGVSYHYIERESHKLPFRATSQKNFHEQRELLHPT